MVRAWTEKNTDSNVCATLIPIMSHSSHLSHGSHQLSIPCKYRKNTLSSEKFSAYFIQ